MAVSYDQIFVLEKGQEIQPRIRVGAPTPSSKGDYASKVEFDGFSQKLEKEVFGVTEPQALVLAIRFVNYLIINSDEFRLNLVFCRFTDGSTELLTPSMLGIQSGDENCED